MVGACIFAILLVAGGATAEKAQERDEKAFSVFSVISFPNDACAADNNRNGTCYTASECTDKKGTASGSCASAFGVCCTFQLDCDESASENNTYLVQASFTTGINSCCYSIGKMDDNICRIRFDFTTMVLSNPVLGTAAASGPTLKVGSTGHCMTDQFTIGSSTGGTPVICGVNSGQHMIVDAADTTVASFMIGSTTSASRSWDIYVTQFLCGTEDWSQAGPKGCLQYFTGTTNAVASYNFPTGTTVGASATHLANQHYTVCIRRESGRCSNCYTPIHTTDPTIVTTQASFGVSISTIDAVMNSAINSLCTLDYLTILNGVGTATGGFAGAAVHRFCGRTFATLAAQQIAIAGNRVTVCTSTVPFRIGVDFDSSEALGTAATENLNEGASAPSGFVGFKLVYTQQSCS